MNENELRRRRNNNDVLINERRWKRIASETTEKRKQDEVGDEGQGAKGTTR